MYINLGYSIILIPVIKQKEEHVLIIIRGKFNQDLKQKCKVVESENDRTKYGGLLKGDVFYD
jgi:hypothetical protein